MTELIQPAPGGVTKLAQDLLACAEDLGLPPRVVDWQPSRNGFLVPDEVAGAYAAQVGGLFTGTLVLGMERVAELDPGVGEEPVTVSDLAAGGGDGPPEPAENGNGTARRYSDDEKADAVRQVLEDGRSIRAVAEDIGASENTVSRWVKTAREALGGNGG